MLITLLLTVPILFWILYRIKHKRWYELAAKIPSSNYEFPLIGTAYKFIRATPADYYTLLKNLSYQCIQNGGVLKIWLGPSLRIFLTNAEDVEYLLKYQLNKTFEYDLFKDFIGNSTLNAAVPIWKRHRKILIPAFTSKMIDSYIPTFTAKSKNLMEKLEKYVDVGEFELFPHISAFELDIVCETTLGVNVKCQEDSNHPFLTQVEFVMEITSQRMFSFWQHSDWVFKLMPQYTMCIEAREKVYDFILKIIQIKKEEIKAKRQKSVKGNELDVTASKIPSFLELVLNLEGDAGYSDTELVQELLALTLAGTDTSALSLCFMFELLAKYPDIQEKVYQELKDVFGDSDRPLEKEDFPKLQYMERVIKESLRLYGAAGVIGRKANEEIKLPSGFTLPEGCDAVISIFGVHRDPKYWGPDAENFDPDRFLPERQNLAPPCCYLPFSYGPRNCPGFHFGNMTLKIAISDVIRRFKLIAPPEKNAAPDLEAKLDILIKPLHGVRIALKHRN